MKLFKFEKVMLHVVLITACIFVLLFMCRTIYIWFIRPSVLSVYDSFYPASEAFQVMSEELHEASESTISY